MRSRVIALIRKEQVTPLADWLARAESIGARRDEGLRAGTEPSVWLGPAEHRGKKPCEVTTDSPTSASDAQAAMTPRSEALPFGTALSRPTFSTGESPARHLQDATSPTVTVAADRWHSRAEEPFGAIAAERGDEPKNVRKQ